MRRDELLEADRLSELLLAITGVAIFLGLVIVVVAAAASTAILR